jgi:hypothetical protein
MELSYRRTAQMFGIEWKSRAEVGNRPCHREITKIPLKAYSGFVALSKGRLGGK